MQPWSTAEARAERLEFAFAKAARPFIWFGLLIWESTPDGRHHQRVDVSQLSDRDERVCVVGAYRVGVDPLRGIGVAFNLEILAQVLVTDRTTFLQQGLDLPKHKSVSLHRG